MWQCEKRLKQHFANSDNDTSWLTSQTEKVKFLQPQRTAAKVISGLGIAGGGGQRR